MSVGYIIDHRSQHQVARPLRKALSHDQQDEQPHAIGRQQQDHQVDRNLNALGHDQRPQPPEPVADPRPQRSGEHAERILQHQQQRGRGHPHVARDEEEEDGGAETLS